MAATKATQRGKEPVRELPTASKREEAEARAGILSFSLLRNVTAAATKSSVKHFENIETLHTLNTVITPHLLA